jgi:hypothetical protein
MHHHWRSASRITGLLGAQLLKQYPIFNHFVLRQRIISSIILLRAGTMNVSSALVKALTEMTHCF